MTGAGVAAGIAVAFAWLLLFGLIGRSLAGYVWWTLLAGALAWLVALALLRYGDRGVGAGVALATSLGWSVAVVALALRWLADGDWPLW